jgi:hypothetical protein
MSDSRIKILYIAGSGRCGSTILGRVLGQIDGFFFAGEMCKIWRYGLIENRLCGCGRPFNECGFWQDVMHDTFGDMEKVDGREIYDLRRKSAYSRHIPLFLIPGGKSLISGKLVKFQNILERLYSAIQSHTNCRVIVDCSKTAPYGYVLGDIKSIDLHVVHIVRDPRGVGFSRLEKRLYQPDEGKAIYTGSTGIVRNAMTWNIQNFAAEAFWERYTNRYMRIHYEEFASNSRAVVSKIVEMLKEKVNTLPFTGDNTVKLDEKYHTAAGNPVRFNHGKVKIEQDLEWMTKLSRKNQLITKLVTWPMFLKYGYQRQSRI